MQRNTKDNHYFPKCLIKQWLNSTVDKYPNALQICDKELNIKRKEAQNILFEKNSIRKTRKSKQAKMTISFPNT